MSAQPQNAELLDARRPYEAIEIRRSIDGPARAPATTTASRPA